MSSSTLALVLSVIAALVSCACAVDIFRSYRTIKAAHARARARIPVDSMLQCRCGFSMPKPWCGWSRKILDEAMEKHWYEVGQRGDLVTRHTMTLPAGVRA